MKPSDAMKQAPMTASEYARDSLEQLCLMLGIDRREKDWQAKLAPFAPVWAAMVRAAASDFETAVSSGAVDGFGPAR